MNAIDFMNGKLVKDTVEQVNLESILKLSVHNAKLKALSEYLGKSVFAFDLPSGVTCSAALDCLAAVNTDTGKLIKGKHAVFTCYAAKLEGIYRNVLRMHYHNLAVLQLDKRNVDYMFDKINAVINPFGIGRIHSFGEYFNESYFKAWIKTANVNPDKILFGYTKMLPFLIRNELPDNFTIQYSLGGIYDNAILEGIYRTGNVDNIPFNAVIDKTWNISGVTGLPLKFATKLFDVNGKSIKITVPVQVNKFDDYNFIRERRSFGIILH